MDNEAQIWERKKVGLEMRQRYELYFATLIFTLLGLAIQTAQAPRFPVLILWETGAWACLLAAGLISLWRLARIWWREFRVGEYFEARHEASDRHKNIFAELNRLDLRLAIAEVCRWALFVTALVSLAISRAGALLG